MGKEARLNAQRRAGAEARATGSGFCHELIAETAKEMAATAYEERASHSNYFYEKFPDLTYFVDNMWPHFIETARHTLAQMLNTTLDDALKDQIAEALIKDNALRRNRHLQIRPEDVKQWN